MPQFLALQCYRCQMMQVKQEKKSSNKWSCSLCNEKQSVRKVYASSGAAKDIRKFVQDFNLSHHSRKESALADAVADFASPESEDFEFVGPGIAYGDSTLSPLRENKVFNINNLQAQKQSKWEEYLPTEIYKVHVESSEDASENIKFVTSIPEPCRRKRNPCVAEEVGRKFQLQGADKSGPSSSIMKVHTEISSRDSDEFVNRMPEGREASMYSNKIERQARSGLDIQNPLAGPVEGIKSNQNSEFCAKKVPQKRVSGIHFEKNSECVSKRSFVRSNFLDSETVPSDTQRQGVTVAEASNKPISKWATFLGDVDLQLGREKQESPMSKWEKFGTPGEASSQVQPKQAVTKGKSKSQMATSKWEEFLSFDEEPLSRINQREETANIWSMRAASSLQSLPGSIKTKLDELIDTEIPAESVDEEVHPLFM